MRAVIQAHKETKALFDMVITAQEAGQVVVVQRQSSEIIPIAGGGYVKFDGETEEGALVEYCQAFDLF